jgi:polysaccharide deacetylase 2 family uncharacterized protein YibQ
MRPVASDDLDAPLGQTKRKSLPKLPVSAPQLLAGVLALFGFAVVGWAIFADDPLGGEPVAVVATRPADAGAQAKSGQTADAGDGQHHARYDGPAGAKPGDKPGDKPADKPADAVKIVTPPPGSKTVTIIDGSNGQSHDVLIPGNPGAPGAATPKVPGDSRLMEPTRHGSIPRIAPDGTRPSVAYAHPRSLPPNKADLPRIAIIVSGLGISASGTADAFDKLPAPVTFAFAPYGADLNALATRAAAANHEVLLQAPMEPFDYPNNDPGPQTLLTSLSPEQNVDRLHWLMSRFSGYVGVIGYMGARFTASEQALSPVLRDTAKRGLIFVDDGASPRSLAGQIAGSQNLPFVKTDVVLDAVPTPVEIDRALARLELAARERGNAVGLANALPGSIARIAAWAKTVESRGFVLVPVSMVAVKEKSS